MGCCVSADVVVTSQLLDDIQTAVKDAEGKDRDEKLETLTKCAADLREELVKIIEAGAHDRKGARRIEGLSEEILTMLLKLLNLEVLGSAESSKVVDQCMCVAKELDPLRSTKATTVIEGHVEKFENDTAAPLIEQMKSTLAQMTEPSRLVPGSRRVLDAAKKVHELVPKNTTITDQLLRGIIELATIILKPRSMEVWLVDARKAASIKDIAVEVDEIAVQLVAVMEAPWDPAFAPQVESAAQHKAEAVCEEKVAACQTEVDQSKCQNALKHLEDLKPWWPHLKDGSIEVVGAFSKVQTDVLQQYLKFAAAGNESAQTAIKTFAQKFDNVRAGFEGLPPPAGGELVSQLETGKAKVTAEKQMAVLEAEVAKETDDDDATNMNLGTTVQAFEALVAVWETLVAGEPAIVDRVEALCDSMEAWALTAARTANAKKVDLLLKFSLEYDSRREKLVPPALTSGALQPRVATEAAATHLEEVEAELAKDGAAPMNAQAVLDGLTAASKALAIVGDAGGGLRERQKAALATSEERVRKSFSEAVALGSDRKTEGLIKFASSFQEVKVAGGEAATGDGEGLAEDLKRELEVGKPVATELHAAKTELMKQRGTNVHVVLQALKDLGDLWEPVAASEPFRNQLLEVLKRFNVKLSEACARNFQGTDFKKRSEGAKVILRLACDIDTATEALKNAEGEAPDVRFRRATCLGVADANLKIIEAELAKETGMQQQVLLKSIQDLELVWQDALEEDATMEASLEIQGRLEATMAKFSERMTKSMQEGVSAGHEGKQKALLQYAAVIDSAFNKVAGDGASSLKASLEALIPLPEVPAAVPEEEAPKEECAKEEPPKEECAKEEPAKEEAEN